MEIIGDWIHVINASLWKSGPDKVPYIKEIIDKISKRFSSIIPGEINFQFSFKDKGDEAAFNFHIYDGIEI